MTENNYDKLKDAICELVNIAEDATSREVFEILDNAGVDVIDCLDKLSGYEAIGTIDEFKALKDAEEQGLLLRLPCKAGDTIWFVGNDFVNDYEIRRYLVDETGIDCVQVAKEIDGREYWNSFSIDYIGKTVFLTREEAEHELSNKQKLDWSE